MTTRWALLALCLLLEMPRPAPAQPDESVVKVIASTRFPNPVRPWTKGDLADNVGTGVVIEGKRILTNAHVVTYATEVYVQARPGSERVEAKVEALAPDVDLAVLTVKDDRFFQKKPALARSPKLPRVQDGVTVYGFPIGGNDLSVTKGVVSRIEVGGYGSRGMGLVIQVSAAINPGNSGGPAVVDGKMIGVVVSRFNAAQNIGNIIPNEEVELFLEDIKDGRYDGKAGEYTTASYQRLENEALRRLLKLDPTVQGVLVHPPRESAASFPLKKFDILTKIGTYSIDNEGMVQLGNGLRVPFLYMVSRLAKGDAVPVTVRRKGQQLNASLPLTREDDRLIREYDGRPLPYFIHGPLVFAPVKAEDISLYSQMNRTLSVDNSQLVTRRFDRVRFPGEELVVVSAPLFAHKVSKGYGNVVGKVIQEVNGVRIKNLRHLVETLRDCKEEFLTFQFADSWSEVLVFDRREIERATEEIMEDHGIAPSRRGSADMLRAWKAKTAPAP